MPLSLNFDFLGEIYCLKYSMYLCFNRDFQDQKSSDLHHTLCKANSKIYIWSQIVLYSRDAKKLDSEASAENLFGSNYSFQASLITEMETQMSNFESE